VLKKDSALAQLRAPEATSSRVDAKKLNRSEGIRDANASPPRPLRKKPCVAQTAS
jgi:hypothetical protein